MFLVCSWYVLVLGLRSIDVGQWSRAVFMRLFLGARPALMTATSLASVSGPIHFAHSERTAPQRA